MVEDERVMEEVRDGEVGKLEILFERYSSSLFKYFLNLTSDRATAEDLVQEVFFRILKFRHTYRAESDLPGVDVPGGAERLPGSRHPAQKRIGAAGRGGRSSQRRDAGRPAVAAAAANRPAAARAGKPAAGKTRGADPQPLPGMEIPGDRGRARMRGGDGEGTGLPRHARVERPLRGAFRTGAAHRLRRSSPAQRFGMRRCDASGGLV